MLRIICVIAIVISVAVPAVADVQLWIKDQTEMSLSWSVYLGGSWRTMGLNSSNGWYGFDYVGPLTDPFWYRLDDTGGMWEVSGMTEGDSGAVWDYDGAGLSNGAGVVTADLVGPVLVSQPVVLPGIVDFVSAVSLVVGALVAIVSAVVGGVLAFWLLRRGVRSMQRIT